MIKTLQKVGTDRTYFYIIKPYITNPQLTSYSTVKGWKKVFPIRSGIRQGYPPLSLLFNSFRSPSQKQSETKRNKRNPNWRRSIQFARSVIFNSLRPHRLQHTRLPCPSPTPGAYSNSFPLSQWCHPTISFSVVPFSSHLQSFPASGSFPMRQSFTSGGQRIGVSTSVLPMNIQD